MNHQYLLEDNYRWANTHLANYVSVFNKMVIPFMRKFSIDDAATIKKFILTPDFAKMRKELIEREVSRGVGRDYAAMLIDNMMQKYFAENRFPGCYERKDEESGLMIPLVPANPGNSGDTKTLIVVNDEEGRNIIAVDDKELRKMHTKTLCDQEQKLWEVLHRFADEMNELGRGGAYLPDLFDQDHGKMRVKLYTF